MARLLSPTPPPIAKPVSIVSRKVLSRNVGISGQSSDEEKQHTYKRRGIALGLVGAVLGLNAGANSAKAAARRPPPPPPPEEKKDPNMSGLTAKVLASKKRKEAMKESIAKLREKGKLVQE